MRFLGNLVRSSTLAVVFATVLAGLVAEATFPLTDEQRHLLRLLLAATAIGASLIVAAAAAWATGPIRGAALRRGAVPETAVLIAAASAHRLPARLSFLVLALGTASSAVAVATLRRHGLASDVANAGFAVGLASALTAAMLVHAVAAAGVARVIEALGPGAAVAVQGTVRGKILIVGLGLATIGFLVLGAASYARYRSDVDHEYLSAALRAQESAVAAAPGAHDEEVAEHVWVVTAAPTALVGPTGRLVARYGSGPFAQARGAPGWHRLDAQDGWLVQSRASSGAMVVSWLREEPLRQRRNGFLRALLLMGGIVYLAAAAVAWMAARAITIPFRTLGRAADRIASGDLTASPPSISRDEMGQLAADFRRMSQGLKGLVVDVQAASEGVSLGAREAGAIGERVRHGALDQHSGVVSVQAAVEAMEGSISLVSRGVSGLSEYVAQTNGAVAEMAASFDEVRRKGADLEKAMAQALADVDHLANAGRETESTLGALESLAAHADGTLSNVRASVTGLERAASESEVNAARVADMAERAGGVVEETVHGIDTLRSAVSDAHRRIGALGRRSDDIDQVVDFISEVAGRTNLLSLNASIIAAQAGEHGKAFGVVADQIRELAVQIARSTKSIGDIIRAVREDVEATAALIDRGDALAVEGVQLARNSLEALSSIQRSTQQARETAAAIRTAVEAHAASSREIGQLVETITAGSRAVSSAVQLVGRSVTGVGSVSRSVNAMADQVARALEEQSGLGKRQLESLARLERMIGDLTRAVESHNAATHRVRDSLQNLSDTAGEHEAAVEGLAGVADRLGARARSLAERVGRFKV